MQLLSWATAACIGWGAVVSAQESKTYIRDDQDVRAELPIDFSKVPRELKSEPEYSGAKRYGLFLFGEKGEVRVWCVLDKKQFYQADYDVLYVDLDADGRLGEKGERFVGKEMGENEHRYHTFDIGDYTPPGSKVKHTEWKLNSYPTRISFRMNWRGEKLTMGTYGPERDTYQNFGTSLADAPIWVPGWDRPFQFEHWMSGELTAGKTTPFKVFVGNRGDRTGTFSCVDDEFLPDEEWVQATLLYTDLDGKKQRYQVKLEERC